VRERARGVASDESASGDGAVDATADPEESSEAETTD